MSQRLMLIDDGVLLLHGRVGHEHSMVRIHHVVRTGARHSMIGHTRGHGVIRLQRSRILVGFAAFLLVAAHEHERRRAQSDRIAVEISERSDHGIVLNNAPRRQEPVTVSVRQGKSQRT